MNYITPDKVVAPQRRWTMFEVLLDKGEGCASYAIGKWDKERAIVFRYNGTADSEGGNPQSRGHPTWIVLDRDIYDVLIDKFHALSLISDEKAKLAKVFLNLI